MKGIIAPVERGVVSKEWTRGSSITSNRQRINNRLVIRYDMA